MYRLQLQDRETFIGRDATLVIGREPASALRLTDGGISDRHAAIERHADGYYVRDLDSANGVRVNGQRVAEQRLASGDEIELGTVRLVFEIVHEPPPERRAFDPWQAVAVGAIALFIAGQVALFGWIFSTEHPRGARTDLVRGAKPSPPSANSAPAGPLPPLPATEPGPAVPAPVVLNRMIKIARVDGLRIQIKAQVAERELDPSQIAVSVQCGNEVKWLPVPQDWENFTSRTLTAPCPGIVRTYYRKKLQDEWTSR